MNRSFVKELCRLLNGMLTVLGVIVRCVTPTARGVLGSTQLNLSSGVFPTILNRAAASQASSPRWCSGCTQDLWTG